MLNINVLCIHYVCFHMTCQAAVNIVYTLKKKITLHTVYLSQFSYVEIVYSIKQGWYVMLKDEKRPYVIRHVLFSSCMISPFLNIHFPN